MLHAVLWQRAEGAILFLSGLAIHASVDAGLSLWLAVVVFFLPDISFAGYALGPRVGAIAYNAVHNLGLGAACLALGLALDMPALATVGALWLAHSGFDRMLGYGLKSPEAFTITHLGLIGKARRDG